MNSNNRREYILNKLEKDHSVKIQELSKEMKVTRETVRRDLYQMESEGLIKKIHGGAILEVPNQETDYEKRKSECAEEKAAIAKVAASYIEEGDSVYLDYGTTTLALAKEIAKMKNITVVTNTIPIVNVLIANEEINLIIPGGIVRYNETSLSGPFALNNIKDINVTLGYFGCSGIDMKVGVTSHNIDENLVSKEMIHHSQTTIVLADDTKFGNVAFNKTADLADIDIIITDQKRELDESQFIAECGINLIVADKD
ncbi:MULTISPECIES: DeoR/GlpR family DNA-binding transcription regulator [Enterococcus]|uniref:DeoR/GlpR family DNA-binding transcription regulator n=1 Tax=Enterococcus TaxID=1350 RepID=UPI0002A4077D|nr:MULTISPECIES: DeoR/GlpR family DNA-binding transcription regulator [Enterococcus]ELB05488.1 hypothetical protein OIG_04369 [Enterococcus faecium EnGen0028]MDT6323801.1 DeoR/GlpR family DNA-binding transcription regulator [Enterococcus faecium]HAQ4672464.1 DeoR/GlpR transcriptional regulator [Enterococcus faecium]HAQ4706613.1 DeoR/GlpR transcriptional regulator [Enterococcus faecium]HAR1638579.1 DeoR/GlpR transcriptional regulator [Enterococcus faecium]